VNASVSHGAVAPSAVEATIADLVRTLCRDRAHAVVVAPGFATEALLRRFEERLGGSLRVARVVPGLREDELCPRILLALRQESGGDAETRLLGLVGELARQGSALVLLLSEPGSMPAPTLRRLGRLATVARPGLRLALVVPAGGGSDAAIAEVVSSLGIGAEKIILHTPGDRRRSGATAHRRAEGSRSQAPASQVTPRNDRPRADVSPRRGATAVGIALAVFALWTALFPWAPPPVAPQSHATAQVGAPPAVTQVAAASARPILVNLNASPWARIEVDGQPVGVTPLANLPLAPGPHRFRARFPDGRVLERVEQIETRRNHVTFP
jgi:hypothetical protein